MDTEAIIAAAGIYLGTFVVAAIGSVVPLVSIEVFLVAITIAHPDPALALPIVILASAGQLVGKLPIYAVSRGVASIRTSTRPVSRMIERSRLWAARRKYGAPLVLAGSAVLGLPPFSIIATTAGVLAIRLRMFCAVIAVGRAVRFAVIIAATSHAT